MSHCLNAIEVGRTYLFRVSWIPKPFVARVDKITTDLEWLYTYNVKSEIGLALNVRDNVGGWIVGVDSIQECVNLDPLPS